MSSIKDVLKQKIFWYADPDRAAIYICDSYPHDASWIRVNDFPEEPFGSLFFEGESIDFNETPKEWSVNFRSK